MQTDTRKAPTLSDVEDLATAFELLGTISFSKMAP
jgi:hypothetical protein